MSQNIPPVPTEEDMKAIRSVRPEDMPWLPPPPERQNKFFIKMKENPFVPIGCVATVAALTYGLFQFNRGDTARSQLAMRLRVAAQGFTVVALIVGVLHTQWREKKSIASKPKRIDR